MGDLCPGPWGTRFTRARLGSTASFSFLDLLQLALEDDVDFLSSSAMPSIMNPLNASTMYHDKSRLPQILTDKAESLQRDGVFPLVPDEDREDGDDDGGAGASSQPSHELSNVREARPYSRQMSCS